MIKANELRTGNKVNIEATTHTIKGITKDWVVSEWDGANDSLIEDYINGYEEIQPIAITEKILLKCGFEKINHIGGYSFYSLKRKRNSNYPSICIYSTHTTIGNNSIVKHCEHLHQLQNLYFALTGKELEINL